MLDRHSALAIPSESYFIPQLWDRHERSSADEIVEDLGRIARVRDWGVTPEDVRSRFLRERASTRSSTRSTARTPSRAASGATATRRRRTCSVSGSLERVFPGAQFVHIVRDGRDAASRSWR